MSAGLLPPAPPSPPSSSSPPASPPPMAPAGAPPPIERFIGSGKSVSGTLSARRSRTCWEISSFAVQPVPREKCMSTATRVSPIPIATPRSFTICSQIWSAGLIGLCFPTTFFPFGWPRYARPPLTAKTWAKKSARARCALAAKRRLRRRTLAATALTADCCMLLALPRHFVPSEAVAKPVGESAGEPIVAAGEPLRERLVDQRERHFLFERLLDGPGAGRAAGDVVVDVAEVGAFLAERLFAEFEQPRADHGAVVPRARDGFQIEVVATVRQKLESLAVGLHERVLDAVVDHLDVMTASRGAHSVVAVGAGRDGVEDRRQLVVGPLGAADHQREAEFGAGGAAAGAAVQIRRVGRLRSAHRVLEVGVTAVDDD